MKRASTTQRDKGFTLIELLVVVAIIGVLVGIAIPLYLNYRKNASDSSAQADLRNAVSVLEQCHNSNNGYPSGLGSPSGDAYTSMSGCSGERINLSRHTELTYHSYGADHATACTTAPCETYELIAANTDGGKTYHYQSWTAGSVK